MTRILGAVLVVSCAMSTSVGATVPAPVSLADMFQRADLVVVAQVTGGELIGTGKEACGAKYSALVEEAFKGARKGATIEFGNYYGFRMGSRYLLFLTRPGRTFEPIVSTNSWSARAKSDLDSRCGRKLERNTVMHNGFGAIQIETQTFRDVVFIPGRFVVLPPGTPATPATTPEYDPSSEPVWLTLEDMIQLLKGFQR